MVHCDRCGVFVGESSRRNFVSCPHGDETCEPSDPCKECRAMAGEKVDTGIEW